MKLRNKNTGEVWFLEHIALLDNPVIYENGKPLRQYTTLAELNEEWEDYSPAEPLIKDEKVRKAVRAWAEACGINSKDTIEVNWEGFNFGSFIMYIGDEVIEKSGFYTITELCGEEEE